MSHDRSIRPALANVAGRALQVLALLGASTVPAFAGGDPFSGIAQAIDSAGKLWGPALLVLSALIAGGAIGMGSHQSGEKVRNFLIGAIFLALAAAGGAAILAKINGLGVN
jgi:hypothetical protein